MKSAAANLDSGKWEDSQNQSKYILYYIGIQDQHSNKGSVQLETVKSTVDKRLNFESLVSVKCCKGQCQESRKDRNENTGLLAMNEKKTGGTTAM